MSSCNTCSLEFERKPGLIYHLEKAHIKSDDITCHECAIQFGSETNFIAHILQVHRKERPFQCNNCEYAASTKKQPQNS